MFEECLAMAKRYTDKQRKVYIKTTEEVVLPETTAEFGGGSIGHYAPETPLDVAEGDRLTIVWDGVQYSCTVSYDEQHGMMWFGNTAFMIGEDTGEPFLYIAVSNSSGSSFDFTAYTGVHTFSIVKHAEYIDPKYLLDEVKPKIVDFDEIGLSYPILSLVNAGGGDLSLPSLDGGGEVSEAMCRAIPKNGRYIVKMTVNGMGTMYINPVYTLFDDNGFKAAHFDCYLENGAELNKFYVRLYRSAEDATYDVGLIRVGFYT